MRARCTWLGKLHRLPGARRRSCKLGIDVLKCPSCSGRTALIATIEDAAVARKILEHLGLPARGPPRPAPWVRQPAPCGVAAEASEGVAPPSLSPDLPPKAVL